MTALSHLFAWFWFLLPGGLQPQPTAAQIQPCSTPVETTCRQDTQQEQERRKPGPLRQWLQNHHYGISNGI